MPIIPEKGKKLVVPLERGSEKDHTSADEDWNAQMGKLIKRRDGRYIPQGGSGNPKSR